MIGSIFALYITLGILITFLIWNRYYSTEYKNMRELGLADDSMVIVWFIFMIVLWPIGIFNYLK